MSEANYEVDLTSCDREPIHKLGMIQGFGALLAVTSDWIVAFRSENSHEILDSREEIAIGNKLSYHFSESAMQDLRNVAANARDANIVERLFNIDLMKDGKSYDVALHISGNYIIIEMERASDERQPALTTLMRPIRDRLEKADDVQALCVEGAKQLKRMLGFDRVMVYRFHPDESGEVIAEAREPHLEAFLNLRYPKTDIPQQARRLYIENLFRIICNVNAQPVPIEPKQGLDGNVLDLSQSTLRAVSPIHIEYLQNMGVEASLSISIVIGGKLWGLFACHHYSPRSLPFERRTMAELFSQLFSMQLDIAVMSAGTRTANLAAQMHQRLMTRVAEQGSLAGNLKDMDEAIGQVIPHEGMTAFIDEEYSSRGRAPNEEEFRALVPSLNTSSTSTLVHSDSLVELIPAAKAFADRAVGALIIPVSRKPRDYVALWRSELTQSVTWAGNPNKVATVGPNGSRLTPRKSFEAWQQSVSGRSAPWREEEVRIAENLRVTLLEVILRITDEQMQERAKSQERQELLIAELNHRVRNILTLIRSLIGQSKGEARDIEQFSEIVGGRVKALAMAHDMITRQQWAPASLKELIRAESEAYLSGKNGRINITGPDAEITPEAFTVIALVMHEMMTNSAKYGSLCDSKGTLDIELSFTSHTDLQIKWRERGGPPVKAPTRRGFGSTIIDRSIPYELNGTADIRYLLKGVEADFIIPSKYAEPAKNEVDDINDEGEAAPSASMIEQTDKSFKVLLVEDSMIIAMDAEEMLSDLGFANIAVASSVEQAMREVDEEAPLFAILDFNLGDETSEGLAMELSERKIPFWFATGYGDAMEKLSDSSALGVIQKPYAKEDLEKLIGELATSKA